MMFPRKWPYRYMNRPREAYKMIQWKRGFSFFIFFVLIFIIGTQVYAQARGSNYIKGYSVSAQQGSYRGQIDIVCNIAAKSPVQKIGVLKIEIYQSDGQRITTIHGTTSNGLLSSKSNLIHIVTYTYKGTPGMSYYAKVTLCAGSASNYDTRLVRTQTVKAPK